MAHHSMKMKCAVKFMSLRSSDCLLNHPVPSTMRVDTGKRHVFLRGIPRIDMRKTERFSKQSELFPSWGGDTLWGRLQGLGVMKNGAHPGSVQHSVAQYTYCTTFQGEHAGTSARSKPYRQVLQSQGAVPKVCFRVTYLETARVMKALSSQLKAVIKYGGKKQEMLFLQDGEAFASETPDGSSLRHRSIF